MESMEDVQMPRTNIVALKYDGELIAIPRPKTKLVSLSAFYCTFIVIVVIYDDGLVNERVLACLGCVYCANTFPARFHPPNF